MKLFIMILTALFLTACNSGRGFQPPPEGYEKYHRHNTPSDIIQKDMLDCGFPNIYNNAPMLNHDVNRYVISTLCMESKGYRTSSGKGGICSTKSFKNTEACLKHLSQ